MRRAVRNRHTHYAVFKPKLVSAGTTIACVFRGRGIYLTISTNFVRRWRWRCTQVVADYLLYPVTVGHYPAQGSFSGAATSSGGI